MRKLGRTAGIVTAVAVLAASAVPALAADTAKVRVLHASPDAPAVDVYLNDEIVDALTNVPFGTLSGYLDIPAGTQNIKVYATGTTDGAVIDADVDLGAGSAYTVAAAGALADIMPKVITDGAMPAPDKAMVRVIHLSPDAPAVDVAPDGADPEDAVVMGLEFPDATDYLALDGGEYDLEVRLAGTTDVALQLDPLTIENGEAYSVFAIGSAASPALGENPLSVLIGIDTMAMPDTAVGSDASSVAGGAAWIVALLLGLVAFAFTIGRRRQTALTNR